VATLNVYDIKGKVQDEITLSTIPDDFTPNEVLIARSLRRQLANARNVYGHVKNRGEVRGGGRKPYRQKGTGRARHGTNRALQWRGGNVAFGPQANRNFSLNMNKKERRAALRQLIWARISEGDWLLFGDLDFDAPSTKKAKTFLESLSREGQFLVVIPGDEKYETVRRSFRNLSNVSILPPERLNTYDILNNDTVLVHRDAFETVRATWQV
jgi:large subunit ribosomal protein L4